MGTSFEGPFRQMKDAHFEWCKPWTETQPTLRRNHRESVCSWPIAHVPRVSWTIIPCSAYWRTRPPSERRTCHLTACCRLHRTPPRCNILQTSGLRQTPPPGEWLGGARLLHGTWWEFGGGRFRGRGRWRVTVHECVCSVIIENGRLVWGPCTAMQTKASGWAGQRWCILTTH